MFCRPAEGAWTVLRCAKAFFPARPVSFSPAALSPAPQWRQNFAPAAFSLPHCGHTFAACFCSCAAANGFPQELQNFAPAAFSIPHLRQYFIPSAMPYYSSSPINMLPLVSYYIFLNKKCLFVVLQSRKMLPTGRIQRNLRFVAGDPKGDGVPLWHTTLPAKSSVLYLYPKAGSETAACAPLKHRLL
jgi:hypothetical protein